MEQKGGLRQVRARHPPIPFWVAHALSWHPEREKIARENQKLTLGEARRLVREARKARKKKREENQAEEHRKWRVAVAVGAATRSGTATSLNELPDDLRAQALQRLEEEYARIGSALKAARS